MTTQLALVVCALVLMACAQPPLPPAPTEYWFTQKFDHFGSDTRTWSQRYLVYSDYYDGKGPIFFCPGGESDVRGGYDHNGFMFELGQKLGAFLLFPEHRFYGKSLPFGPVDSYKPENIPKLTIEQAMADYVAIIASAKTQWNIPPTTPLVAYGGSYPGDLTAYMRVAYPDIVHAGFASSAPLRYHAGEVPGGGFFQVVTDTFSIPSATCPDLVRQAFSLIFQESQTPQGLLDVSTRLNLCTPLQSPSDLRMLALWVENAYANIGMENYPYPFGGSPKYPMFVSCNLLQSLYPTDPLLALAQSVGVAYNTSGTDLPCFNISAEYYPCADITGCGGGVGDPEAMSWDYQSCTQVVSNVDTNNVTDMFPAHPYNFREVTDYCLKTWGTAPDPYQIPSKYNYTSATRLILSNGKYDPWYPGGVLPEVCPSGEDMFCFLIDQAAHHLDLRGTDPVNDPPAVTAARVTEKAIITKWVQTIQEELTLKYSLLQ